MSIGILQKGFSSENGALKQKETKVNRCDINEKCRHITGGFESGRFEDKQGIYI